MSNPVLEFQDVLKRTGLDPDEIIAGGNLHQCGLTTCKERGEDGAYTFHPAPPASGWWQNFQTSQEDTWTARSYPKLPPKERHKLDKSKHKTEETLRSANGRNIAERIVFVCLPAAMPPLTECNSFLSVYILPQAARTTIIFIGFFLCRDLRHERVVSSGLADSARDSSYSKQR